MTLRSVLVFVMACGGDMPGPARIDATTATNDSAPDAIELSCDAEYPCTEGPVCGDKCCAAGERCVDGACRCGDGPACGEGDYCTTGGPVAPTHDGCGVFCCGASMGCPI